MSTSVARSFDRGLATWSPSGKLLKASPMVFITGEEMTRYAMELIVKRWIAPNVDTSAWEFFDLSVKNRDQTDDKVLKDAIEAGRRVGAIFKEPTVTPSEAQKVSMGLKKAWGSPNGPMRRGWNGFTISRDTIHIEGMTPWAVSTARGGRPWGAAWWRLCLRARMASK